MIRQVKQCIHIFVFLLGAHLLSDAILVAATPAQEDSEIQSTKEQRPNIILLLADDLGYGDLASYGHPYARTPNLDQLAREGTLFHKFYVAGATCGPSRAGFFTGRNPYSFPLRPADYGFNQAKYGHVDRITVMELLKNAGYAVGHFGKWHIGPNEENGTYGIDEIEIIGGGIEDPRGRDEKIYQSAIAFIEKNKDKPFYLNVMGRVTHAPVTPQSRLIKQAGFNNLIIDRTQFNGEQLQAVFDDIESHGGDINMSMANYLTEVYYLDQFIGELIEKLDKLGLAENTLVAFASDQGPAISRYKESEVRLRDLTLVGWSGGLRGQKHSEYEGGLRSPFILRWPGKVPGGTINEHSVISALDWLPTVSGIAGLAIEPSNFHGEDVEDIWRGSNRSRTDPLYWKISMKTEDWRIHFGKNSDKAVELYNTAIDPAEENNLVNERPEIADKLTRDWKAWQRKLPRRHWQKAFGASGGT